MGAGMATKREVGQLDAVGFMSVGAADLARWIAGVDRHLIVQGPGQIVNHGIILLMRVFLSLFYHVSCQKAAPAGQFARLGISLGQLACGIDRLSIRAKRSRKFFVQSGRDLAAAR